MPPRSQVAFSAATTVLSLAAASLGLVWLHQRRLKAETQKKAKASRSLPKRKKSRSPRNGNNNIRAVKPTAAQLPTIDEDDLVADSAHSLQVKPGPDDDAPPPIAEIDTSVKHQEKSYRRVLTPGTVTIAHGSVTGTCAKLADKLLKELQQVIPTSEDNNDVSSRHIQMGAMDDWDWWDELLNDDGEENHKPEKKSKKGRAKKAALPPPPVLLLIIPTHHAGSWPKTATCLELALQDLKNDWRISKFPLKTQRLQVAVMGMGCSDYGDDTMGQPAREAYAQLRQLGATMIGRKVRVGDDATGNQIKVVQAWIHHDILPVLLAQADDNEGEDKSDDYMQEKEPKVIDMEDMGSSMGANKENEGDNDDDDDDDDDDGAVGTSKNSEPREMVTSTQAAALKKEGYKLIGTHSAVKLCRWTKHQLRGRGGCYKHTFYGITSYQCMEATPSLACANKCVFCWRHHKNPVGKEWKWKTDDPHFIVDQAVKTHVQMIKETRGIPGVNMSRWKEAHTVRHCALSLVGEPIMYPRIDEFLEDLHSRKISTFLVTNGQHPKAIGSLRPITQLYVSVDAPTPETLIEVDRPLFSDAWERLQESLVLLKDKGQRTVARLTVVKGWNSGEISGYAKLIALGKVSLIEIKGVTYCGKSDASNLNMSNTPWHHEVVELARTLKVELDKLRADRPSGDPLPEYELACEHKHSVSVLLARVDQFTDKAADGSLRWNTWINYPKFHELAKRNAKDPTFTFEVSDYTAPTPEWALFGSEEEGFDPTDTRHRRKGRIPKYTKYDEGGIPTHDHNDNPLSDAERQRLISMMEEQTEKIGSGSTITEGKGGEKFIADASLMFRGLTVVQ